MFERLMRQGAVKRAHGRPRLYPERIVGDKGYSSRKIRQFARRHGIRVTELTSHVAHRRHDLVAIVCRQTPEVSEKFVSKRCQRMAQAKYPCQMSTRYRLRFGITEGPITGKLITQVITGEGPDINLAPWALEHFGQTQP
jgi:hypothetical protein